MSHGAEAAPTETLLEWDGRMEDVQKRRPPLSSEQARRNGRLVGDDHIGWLSPQTPAPGLDRVAECLWQRASPQRSM
jgi:hypothetical protein